MLDFNKVFGLDDDNTDDNTEAREVTRLSSIDTAAALAAVVFANKGKPPVDSETGLVYFAGVSARGYGQVGFPLAEALAFATALDTLASGGAVQPRAVTIDTLTATGGRLSMVENLLNATPYVGAEGAVIGVKVSGSNWEGSTKPKGTLIATNHLATVAWFVAFMTFEHPSTPEGDKVALAKLAKKHEGAGAAVAAAYKAIKPKKK
jgi:hypothetical protein